MCDCIATLAHVVFKFNGFEVAELSVIQRAVAGEASKCPRAAFAQEFHVYAAYTDCAEQSSVGGVSIRSSE